MHALCSCVITFLKAQSLSFSKIMDIFFVCAIIFLTLFVCLSLLRLFASRPKAVPNLPPGNFGLPLIGEGYEFLMTGVKGHPEKFINDRTSKFSTNIFKTSILGSPMAVFCGAAANKFLFANENKLVMSALPEPAKRVFPYTEQTSTTEEYKAIRKLLPNFLKPEVVKNYIETMDRITKSHFAESWEGKKEVTVYPLAKWFAFRIGCKLFLNIEDQDYIAWFRVYFNDLLCWMQSIPINVPGTKFHRGIKASEFIRKELRGKIIQRKKDLAESKAPAKLDILTHMLLTTDENGKHMSEADIADKIMGLLMGSSDTSSAAISSTVKFLAELPHIYEGVLKEQMEIANSKAPGEFLSYSDVQKMKYTWNVVCETMRLAPPSFGAFREALQDFKFEGYTVPKGWKIHWSAHSTHKNPEYFPDPEKFDPSRFEGSGPAPFTYVPFGGGPSICPGKELARIVILIFVHNFVTRFRAEKIIPDEQLTTDPMFRPEKGLPIRLIPHAA